ncbi:rRNA-processing protein utp23 [Colletotrichum sojae]|uniref:rRNA-processing protein utp23 n=1 Tax=Colletotrichum sojae TaxID=2175907 RepID=A0A8H6JCP9_9PEZI|nr:rRNA-processing protein utp23 [Colletotrichum sojae]
MRGKRSKQYRKLMNQYSLTWGFREPYQCLVDAEMVVDCQKSKYDLLAGLERTLHGKVKPSNLVNKHRYCVASQSADVRRMLREIPGVPQIYIKRSVMILEPMATESMEIRAKEEKSKFRDGIVKPERKRKREDDDEDEKPADDGAPANGSPEKQKKKKKGPKGPNPLAVKKPKKNTEAEQKHKSEAKPTPTGDGEGDAPTKKKRKRRHRPRPDASDAAATATGAGASASQGEDGSAEQAAGSP